MTIKNIREKKELLTPHIRLRRKSSQCHYGKKLSQRSRVDFHIPMGSEYLWFEYRDLFQELFLSYGPLCATSSEKMKNGVKLPKKAKKWIFLASIHCLQLFLLDKSIKQAENVVFGLFWPFLVIFGELPSGAQKSGQNCSKSKFSFRFG